MYDVSSLKLPPMEKLPEPTGFKLLIALVPVQQKIGSILIPDQHKDRESLATIVGKVVKMGPDAYLDASKFPSGPWCKVDDFVMFRSYSGTRMKVDDVQFVLVNDDTVDGVVGDPTHIERA